MSERKPRLEWKDDPDESRATCGKHHSANVFLGRTGSWIWEARAAHNIVAWCDRRGPGMPTKEAAQLAAEDALREVLTTALRAMDGGGA